LARVVWVKGRWSDTVQSRGVCAGAFGARVGEERASQARWAGALLGVVGRGGGLAAAARALARNCVDGSSGNGRDASEWRQGRGEGAM
jgi:hypothetical protein